MKRMNVRLRLFWRDLWQGENGVCMKWISACGGIALVCLLTQQVLAMVPDKEKQDSMARSMSYMAERIVLIKNEKGPQHLLNVWSDSPTRYAFSWDGVLTWSLQRGYTNEPDNHFEMTRLIRTKPFDCLRAEISLQKDGSIIARTNFIISGLEFENTETKAK